MNKREFEDSDTLLGCNFRRFVNDDQEEEIEV